MRGTRRIHDDATSEAANAMGPTCEALEARLLLDAISDDPFENGLADDAAGGPADSPQIVSASDGQALTGAMLDETPLGAGVVLLDGAPAYVWRHGCGPTAAAMILGYWDAAGYADLITGDPATAIASSGHYNDYSLPKDSPTTGLLFDKSSTGGAHASDSVADFMHTSWSADGNYYGWSYISMMDDALEQYAAYRGYAGANATNLYNSSFTWSVLTNEIDAGRPLTLLVDTDGDNYTDHFVTVVGYDATINTYAYYNTWDTRVHWQSFSYMAPGVTYGIYGATTFTMPVVEAELTVDLANARWLEGSQTLELDVYVQGGGKVSGIDISAQLTAPDGSVIDAFTDVVSTDYFQAQSIWGSEAAIWSEPTEGYWHGGVALSGGWTRPEGLAMILAIDYGALVGGQNYTLSLANLKQVASGYPGNSAMIDSVGAELITDAGGAWSFTTPAISAEIVDAALFYNNSPLDGNDPAANAADDAAIAADKQLLSEGNAPSAANISAYASGLNGVMFDIDGLARAESLSTDDFLLTVADQWGSSTWATATAPAEISVRPGEGLGGSDRVTITWADGAITGKWLEITVRATSVTALATDRSFRIASLPGDITGDGTVDIQDFVLFKNAYGTAATLTDGDFNLDGIIDIQDFVVLKNYYGQSLMATTQTVGEAPSAPAAAIVVEEEPVEETPIPTSQSPLSAASTATVESIPPSLLLENLGSLAGRSAAIDPVDRVLDILAWISLTRS